MSAPDPRPFVERYLAHGFCVLPIPFKAKRPVLSEWQKFRCKPGEAARYFRPPCNVGINLGEPSRGLADVDLDAAEALVLADEFLPPTLAFGRASKPSSHRLYLCPGARTTQYKDPADNSMLVELRATPASAAGLGVGGSQTVVPPSTHPSGELVAFTPGWRGLPLELPEVTLRTSVAALAVATLVTRRLGVDVARAFAHGGPFPELDPLARGRVLEWLGVRPEPVRLAPRPGPLAGGAPAGGQWLDRVRALHPADVAQALGLPASRDEGIGRCPSCGAETRSSSDRRVAVAFTTSRDGVVLWHHGKCGAHGNSVQLAALLLLGMPRPTEREQWTQLRTALAERGVI